MFRPYIHIERFGTDEVEGIELGQVYLFPKIDGTNASVWLGGCGSRTRVLSLEEDNAGFMAWLEMRGQQELAFVETYPNLRLYGEWLVPHTFRGYRPEVWRQFYVFDVLNDETGLYLTYETYSKLLDQFNITYIPPLAIIKNGDYERFLKYVHENKFLCFDNGEPGEGVVLKNYDYYNKFGRQTWAKIIRQEFKDKHALVMGAPNINTGLMNEERILLKVLTSHFVDKTYNKIKTEKGGWKSQYIPELFGRCYYDLVKEELWEGLKEIKEGSVNFKTVKALMIQKIKEFKPELF